MRYGVKYKNGGSIFAQFVSHGDAKVFVKELEIRENWAVFEIVEL